MMLLSLQSAGRLHISPSLLVISARKEQRPVGQPVTRHGQTAHGCCPTIDLYYCGIHAAVVALPILNGGPSQIGHGPLRGTSPDDFCNRRLKLLTIQKYRRIPFFLCQQTLRYDRSLKQLDHQDSVTVLKGSLQSC